MGVEAAALALAAVSAAVGTYGAIQSGQAASQAASYQAQVARNNATVASQNADAAQRQGVLDEQNKIRQNRALIGAQTAGAAANGLDVNSGTAVDIRSGQANVNQQSLTSLRDMTDRKVASYRSQGSNFQADAALAGMRGDQAVTASYISAGQTALSAAGNIGMGYADMQRSGVTQNPSSPSGTRIS
jgi:hypothetical protein